MLLNYVEINRYFICSRYFDTNTAWWQRHKKKSSSIANNFHGRGSLNRGGNTSHLFSGLSSPLSWPNNKSIDLLQSTKGTVIVVMVWHKPDFKIKREEKTACLYWQLCALAFLLHHFTDIQKGDVTYLSHVAVLSWVSLRIPSPMSCEPSCPCFLKEDSTEKTS